MVKQGSKQAVSQEPFFPTNHWTLPLHQDKHQWEQMQERKTLWYSGIAWYCRLTEEPMCFP